MSTVSVELAEVLDFLIVRDFVRSRTADPEGQEGVVSELGVPHMKVKAGRWRAVSVWEAQPRGRDVQDPTTSPSRLLISGSDKIVYGLGPLYTVNGSTVTTYARDGQKSVRAEVNGSTVTSSWRYRAYGDVVQNSGAATPSILGYAGQLLDPSGLYYMRARWYDTSSARFVSRDPARGGPESPLSLNAYAYAQANPLAKMDPSGATCILIGFGAKLAIGGMGSGRGAAAQAAESLFIALCDGGKGFDKGIDSAGLVSVSEHFASGNTSPMGEFVQGLFGGVGVQVGASPNARRVEDLIGEAQSQSIDAGTLWPVDLGLDVSHSGDPAADTTTVSVPGLGVGLGVSYAQTTSTTRSHTFWSRGSGWSW